MPARLVAVLIISLFWMVSLPASGVKAQVIRDMAQRQVRVPDTVDRVVCSGAGCVRLLTYLQCQDRLVGVDDLEKRDRALDPRPYAMAHPELSRLPLCGQFRGQDNPELLLSLTEQPQVIFKTFANMGTDPVELQHKTKIPVVVLGYGDLGRQREMLDTSLRTMARVLSCPSRAEEVIEFFDTQIQTLRQLAASIPESEQPSVFVGGVAFKGPHGFQSTEPGYPPFEILPVRNLAAQTCPGGERTRHAVVSKEQIMVWDPDLLFVDLATLQLGGQASGLYELRHEPGYRILQAVQEGRVYGLLPYNCYATNFGSVLANAYYLGSVLYPQRFASVDVQARADAIFSYLVGEPVMSRMDAALDGLAFDPVPVH